MEVPRRYHFPSIVLVFTLVLMSSFTIIAFETSNGYKKVQYKIRPNSSLDIFGKTNINSFCCVSKEQFEPKSSHYILNNENASIHFQNTIFKIKVENLNCGNKKINHDLFKALKVDEYPEIIIDMKAINHLDCLDLRACNLWNQLEADTDITITCKTQTVKIPILVTQLDLNSFRIKGGTAIRLCDYDIDAPTAMLGLIQVEDEIELIFDLHIDLF